MTPMTAPTAPRPVRDTSREWRGLTIAAALVVTALEAVLLQRKHSLFSGGFLTATPFRTWPDGLAFLGIVALLNATICCPICAAVLMSSNALRLRVRARRFLALVAGVAPLLAADFLMYEIWSFLGDAFDVRLMYQLTGRHVSEIFAVAAPLITRPLGLGILIALGLGAVTWILARTDRTPFHAAPAPTISEALRVSGALVALSAVLTTGIGLSSDAMTYGLRRTPAGSLALQALNRLSDFDFDGYGLLDLPRDSAPFNGHIHPYALEIPGNGIDENGVGGDLPPSVATYTEPPPPSGPWPLRPPVLLFVLESFRADVVGATYNGHPVTPTFDALARSGVSVASAWSHNGFTRQSRFHILTGSLTGRRGTSLLDDFKNHGYEVAYFSGQDDSAFGDSGIDYSRVDRYFDARQDLGNRYSSYTTPGSLAVPFDVVEGHIADYLAARSSDKPLFMYVNFHDTHYPYYHAEMQNILGGAPLLPSAIAPSRRGDLWRTYLNAAANVDAAIGRVIDRVQAKLGVRPAVVVISDHGESLFDRGFIGHGYALDEAQTRVPFIVSGLPMHIATPFGQSRLRDAINEALSGKERLGAPPVVDSGTSVRVFQYLGPLETPGQIGWLTTEGAFTYDFRTNLVSLWDTKIKASALTGEPRDAFDELVHTWESLQLTLAHQHAAGGTSP
jgi:hypothetical protein